MRSNVLTGSSVACDFFFKPDDIHDDYLRRPLGFEGMMATDTCFRKLSALQGDYRSKCMIYSEKPVIEYMVAELPGKFVLIIEDRRKRWK